MVNTTYGLAGFVDTAKKEFNIEKQEADLLDKINEASLTLGEYEAFKKAALDPYIAMREAYSQYRQHKIRNR